MRFAATVLPRLRRRRRLVAGRRSRTTSRRSASRIPDGTTETSTSSNNAKPAHAWATRRRSRPRRPPAARARTRWVAARPARQLRGLGVNTGTGAYTRVEPDLGMASFAVPFTLVRVYSSANTSTGLFGNGWASTLDLKVTGDRRGATVRAEDGAQADFARQDDGSFKRPAGVRSNLKKTADGLGTDHAGAGHLPLRRHPAASCRRRTSAATARPSTTRAPCSTS